MLTEFKAFFTGAKLIVAGVAAAALVLAGGLLAWKAPFIGASAQIAHERDKLPAEQRQTAKWKAGYDAWHGYGQAEQRAFRDSEGLRGQERAAAQASTDRLDQMCDARLAEVRRSSAAITALLSKEPAHDPKTGCAVPGVMDAGQLWNALQRP